MEQLKDKYKDEALELITEMEKYLLLMETNPEDPTLMEQVFRAMHTLKGNSAMFGFKAISDFTHQLESVYDLIRSRKMSISKPVLNFTLMALDHLTLLVNKETSLDEKDIVYHEKLSGDVIALINSIKSSTPANVGPACADETNGVIPAKKINTYHIFFSPHKEAFLNGVNPLHLIDALYELGRCEVVAHIDAIPPLEDCDIATCYTSWDIYLYTSVALDIIHEVFHMVEDKCVFKINQVLENEPAADLPGEPKKHVISGIRVSSERLDSLMSLVSELMTLQAKLGTLAEQNPQSELVAVAENLEKISAQLRDNAFSMCLVPIEYIVAPFHRLVRDLSVELNKEIGFITEGTETALDKNIMESLADSLMHLLRNSIDHGIEAPGVRIKSGKPPQGTILFKASCVGTNVYIEIKDDGRGIDTEKLKNKAISKGIIGKDEKLSEKELLNLVFLPGLSTAEQVSGVSGRGVGMDVVKRKIADIGGQIKIDSQINRGTTITIKIPITVSIIDGLLVKSNHADFVIPLSSIENCYEIPAAHTLTGINNLMVFNGEQIPFINLVEEPGPATHRNTNREMIVVHYEETKVGLLVDQIIGKLQAVLKPLGRHFQHVDTISGATILGDGKIALVLNTNKVIEQYLHNKRSSICL